MQENINLVNITGERIGSVEKMEAHVKGLLHEAFSIFVFNNKGEMLLQRRALSKYHSGGLWTNTCCSHPRVGEILEEAVHRRLVEEMGFDCELERVGDFVYKAEGLIGGLTEHEFDYVFVGEVDGVKITPNPEEVEEYKWVKVADLKADLKNNPENYTAWFKLILSESSKFFD